ncbi:putative transmembrane protein [Tieghemostelium lacteum]|uniref:Putative transmembrane protein n=1 Tax=Tieghemostelium lacteum TaxID=361077 RepID=A0A151ZEI1_TIELA|nr:putative transmembrane protein [Tieghemostelium lacteum]|eukprot:KYQ92337.1 putative transmembrane protein [Tieghemostelium lacteum]
MSLYKTIYYISFLFLFFVNLGFTNSFDIAQQVDRTQYQKGSYQRLKATWDTQSNAALFDPKTYAVVAPPPSNSATICCETRASCAEVSNCIFGLGGGNVPFSGCPLDSILILNTEATFANDGTIVDVVFVSMVDLTLENFLFSYMLISPTFSVLLSDISQMIFRDFTSANVNGSFYPQDYQPSIFVNGGTLTATLTNPNFLRGHSNSSNSIVVENGVTGIITTHTYTLYSESYPNGKAIQGTIQYDSGTLLFSWTQSSQNPHLSTAIDKNVFITIAERDLFTGVAASLYVTNFGTMYLENIFITNTGRTSNLPYSSTNLRSKTPVYVEFTENVVIKNCFFANPNQRADIVAHHATVTVMGTGFAGNSGSSILAEWGTETIISTSNVFLKSKPTTTAPDSSYLPANMDYGYQGNAIYSISPYVSSVNDYIYVNDPSVNGIVIDIIEDRSTITGFVVDYCLKTNIYTYPQASKRNIANIDSLEVIGSSTPLSISTPYPYSPMVVKLGDMADMKISEMQINTPGAVILPDLTIDQPAFNITGNFYNLVLQNSKWVSAHDGFLNSGSIQGGVQFINSYVLDGVSYPQQGNVNYKPGILPSLSITTPPSFTQGVIPTFLYIGDNFVYNPAITAAYKCEVYENGVSYGNFSSPCSFTYTGVLEGTKNLKIMVLNTADDVLQLTIPLQSFEVLPHNNRFFHGYSFNNLTWVEENLNITTTNDTNIKPQQWSKCTTFFRCTISNPDAITPIPFDTVPVVPIEYTNASFLYQSGINSQTKITFNSGLVSYYEFQFLFVYYNNFTVMPQADSPNAAVVTVNLNGQTSYRAIQIQNNVASFLNISVPFKTNNLNQSIELSWEAPPSVFLTNIAIYSNIEPYNYWWIPPTPPPTDPVTEPPTSVKKKDINLIAIIVPVVVGAVAILGAIAFLLYRRKKRRDMTTKTPTSPLRMSGNNSPLKHSGSNISMNNLASGGKIPLVAQQQSSRNLLTSSGSGLKSSVVKEDKYHVDADILTFVQESHYYGWDHPDFPLSFSNTKLDFGMGGMKSPIEHELQDSVTLINKSKKPINVTVLLPASTSAAICDTDQSQITIKPGKTHQLIVSVTLLCTTKYMEKFAIHVEDFGHTYLFIHLESVLSTKLDFNELEFFQPPVGEGSFGVVYRGMWRGQEVAIKQMKVSSINMDEVYREMDLMSKLRHPNIISFIGAVMSSDNLCIVSEFVPLGSLGDILYKGNKRLSLPQKIRIALDIAKGCNFLHQCGIIHRDLKPDNILVVSLAVDAPITIKISDFGTSKEAAELDYSKFTNAVGTPIYMSNQILEKKDYDNATDVYSYAVMFYEIIIEEVPFSEIKNMWDIPRFVISGKRPTKGLENVDPSIVKIINECWAQEATDRPSFKDIIPRLEQILDNLLKSNNNNNNNNNDNNV